jgi:hypothetical protein
MFESRGAGTTHLPFLFRSKLFCRSSARPNFDEGAARCPLASEKVLALRASIVQNAFTQSGLNPWRGSRKTGRDWPDLWGYWKVTAQTGLRR